MGLKVGQTSANSFSVPITTTFGQAAKAFHTGFQDVRLTSGRVAYTYTSRPTYPAGAQAILGLDNTAQPQADPDYCANQSA